TSPAGAIIASIDAARALLSRDGKQLCARLLRLVAGARRRLAEGPGVAVLDGPGGGPAQPGVLPAGPGAGGDRGGGEAIAAGMPVDLGDRDMIVPIVTLADTEDTVERFTGTLVAAIERHRGPARRPDPSPAWSVSPEMAIPPRDAFFSPNETVMADAAVGRISAELVAPYPPGIPVPAPGEVRTAGGLAAARAARAEGGRIAYAADPSLATFQVITAG